MSNELGVICNWLATGLNGKVERRKLQESAQSSYTTVGRSVGTEEGSEEEGASQHILFVDPKRK